MDQITAAIVAALSALTSDIVKTSVKDAYEGLKAIVFQKCGHNSAVTQAIGALEANPMSSKDAAVLANEIAAAHVGENPEVATAAAELLNQLKREGTGTPANIHISVTGGRIDGVVGSNNVSIGSVSFGAPTDHMRR